MYRLLRGRILELAIALLIVFNVLLAILSIAILFSDVIPDEYKKYLIANHVYVPPIVGLFLSSWRFIRLGFKWLTEFYPSQSVVRGGIRRLTQRWKVGAALTAFVLTVLAGSQFWALEKVCSPDPMPAISGSEGLALSVDERFLYVRGRENPNSIDVLTAVPRGAAQTTIGPNYRKLRTIELAGLPRGIGRTPDNKYLYVVYVTDDPAQKGHVAIIALPNHEVIDTLEVGYSPRWIAVSPDGDHVYVSNVYGEPRDHFDGSISMIDAKERKVMQGREIKNVNCPEGLAISPDESRLYVASQCGAGADPLFILDTTTGHRIAEVPGLAVGNSVLLSIDGKKAYVSRANFNYFDSVSKSFGAPLSIIDTASNRIIKTFILQISTGGVALTPDGKYALVTNGFQLSVIDTQTDELVNNLSRRGGGNTIVVRSDNTVIVEVSDKRRIVTFPLSKALAHLPCESVGWSGSRLD